VSLVAETHEESAEAVGHCIQRSAQDAHLVVTDERRARLEVAPLIVSAVAPTSCSARTID